MKFEGIFATQGEPKDDGSTGLYLGPGDGTPHEPISLPPGEENEFKNVLDDGDVKYIPPKEGGRDF